MAYAMLIEGGEEHIMEEQDFPQEEDLASYLERHPKLIPIGEIDEDSPPLLVIGREFSLPCGSIDLLCTDETGLTTIVETKLAKNPELRRTVIGQVLEYAAFLWGLPFDDFESKVKDYFNQGIKYRGQSLAEAMSAYRKEYTSPQAEEEAEWTGEGEEWSPDTFRESVRESLKDANFRIVILTDKARDELKRTLRYLETFAADLQVYCVEVKYFGQAKDRRFFVPTLVGFGRPRKEPGLCMLPEQAEEIGMGEVLEFLAGQLEQEDYLWKRESKVSYAYDTREGRLFTLYAYKIHKAICPEISKRTLEKLIDPEELRQRLASEFGDESVDQTTDNVRAFLRSVEDAEKFLDVMNEEVLSRLKA